MPQQDTLEALLGKPEGKPTTEQTKEDVESTEEPTDTLEALLGKPERKPVVEKVIQKPVDVSSEEQQGFLSNIWDNIHMSTLSMVAGIVEKAKNLTAYAPLRAPGGYSQLPQKLDPTTGEFRTRTVEENEAIAKETHKQATEIYNKSQEIGKRVKQFDKGIWDSIKTGNVLDAGEQLVYSFANTLPNMMAMAVNPYSGTIATVQGAAGAKELEMRQEIKEGKQKYTEQQIQYTSWGYGAADGAADAILGGILRQSGRVIKAMSNSGGDEAVQQVTKNITKQIIGESLKGGAGEATAQITQNALDKYVADKDVSLTDNLIDAFIIGKAFGATTMTSGYLAGKALKAFTPNEQRSIVQRNQEMINTIDRSLDDPNVPDEKKAILRETREQIILETSDMLEDVRDRAERLSTEQVQEVANLDSQSRRLEQAILDPTIDEATRNVLQNRKNEIDASLEEINTQEIEGQEPLEVGEQEATEPLEIDETTPQDTTDKTTGPPPLPEDANLIRGEAETTIRDAEETTQQTQEDVQDPVQTTEEQGDIRDTEEDRMETQETEVNIDREYFDNDKPKPHETRRFNNQIRNIAEDLIYQEGATSEDLSSRLYDKLNQEGFNISDKVREKIDNQIDKVSERYNKDTRIEQAVSDISNIRNLDKNKKLNAVLQYIRTNRDLFSNISTRQLESGKNIRDKTINDNIDRIAERLSKESEKNKVKQRRNISQELRRKSDKNTNKYFDRYSNLDIDDVAENIESLEEKRNKLQEKLDSEPTEELQNEIDSINEEIEIANMVAGFNDKTGLQLSKLEKELADLTQKKKDEQRKYLDQDRQRINERIDRQLEATTGRFDLESSLIQDTGKKSFPRRVGESITGAVRAMRGAVKGYMNYQNALKYLFKRLDKSFELGIVNGKKAWNPRNFVGRDFDAALRQGQSTTIRFRNIYGKNLNNSIRGIFGSIRKATKAANELVNIPVDEIVVVNGEKQIRQSTIQVKLETAAHMLYSSNSESNSDYMNRLGRGPRRYKLNSESLNTLADIMDTDNGRKMFDLTRYQAETLYPSMYNQLNTAYRKLTGTNLPRLDGYLPVNGLSMGSERFDFAKMDLIKIYQSMTKNRTGGYYNIDSNGVISDGLRYIDSSAKFVGLSKPMSDIARVLTNKKVTELTQARDIDGTRKAILDLISEEMSPSKTINLGMALYRNFIVSKVAFHFGLIPKQMVSTLAVFDPDYVSSKYLIQGMTKGLTNKEYRKIAKDILAESYDLKERNLSEIESLYSSATNKGWDLNISKAIEDRIDSLLDKMPDKRRDSVKEILSSIYMPTKFGDKLAIRTAGKPLIIGSYLENMANLEKDGITGVKAERLAREKSLATFEEWMNNTQQTTRFTDRSLFQTGFWRFAMPFTNSLRLYADKITDSYSDMGRNYLANIDYSQTNKFKRYGKALTKINQSKSFQKIALYQVALPVLFSQIGNGFKDIRTLLDDDSEEEERDAAWNKLEFDSTLNWTQGMLLLGHFLKYGKDYSEKGKVYGKDDNIINITDDIHDLIKFSIDVAKGTIGDTEDLSDWELEEVRENNRKIYKQLFQRALNMVGLPGETIRRYEQSKPSEEEGDNIGKQWMQILGASKDQAEFIYGKVEEY